VEEGQNVQARLEVLGRMMNAFRWHAIVLEGQCRESKGRKRQTKKKDSQQKAELSKQRRRKDRGGIEGFGLFHVRHHPSLRSQPRGAKKRRNKDKPTNRF